MAAENLGSTREQTLKVAESLAKKGIKPTADMILAEIGRGSKTTVLSALNEWWPGFLRRAADTGRPDHVPPDAYNLVMSLYDKIEDAVSLREADRAKKAYETAYSELQEALESARLKVAEAESRAEVEKDRARRDAELAASLEKRLSRSHVEIEGLRDQLATQAGKSEALIATLTGKEETIRALSEARNDIANRLTKQEVEAIEREKKLQLRIDQEKTSYEEHMMRQRAEIHGLTREVSAMQERLASAVKNESRERDAHAKTKHELTTHAANLQKELSALLASSHSEISSWREKHMLLEADLQRSQEAATSLRSEVEYLNEQLRSASDVIGMLREENACLQIDPKNDTV